MEYDAIILGGGAAGLMCAARAGGRARRVLVLEKAEAVGKKILISGGGRCNFTNLECRPERFLSKNPRFALSALRRYTPRDFVARVDAAGIAWHEKTLGQLFCDDSARQIVEMLMDECDKSEAAGGRVDFAFHAPISDVRRADDLYHVVYNGLKASAPALVIATGGPSIPKMGATGFAYRIAEQFGMNLIWFGVVTVVAVEIGLLTPPFGLSAYVVKSSLNDPRITLGDIFKGTAPFTLIMVAVLLILAFAYFHGKRGA